ncbi:MAG TPA: pitrilysin family protein [Verrucomicrobiae bacterium]|nr:pitrilysin family protein [Verrucomicrobiae bacterium]
MRSELPAIPPGVEVTTLENGLTIIVQEDHSAPVVSAQAWSMTGSIHEGRWLGSGMSHVLEHMLFKGTTTRPAARIDQQVQEAGGYMNAYTSFDRTVYHIDVPNTGARIAIDILCDIMQNATLPAEEMAKEKQVILREMDMNQDDPGRRAGRRLFETAYTRSPYRFTIIGYPDIYNELQAPDIAAYYHERYAANNVFYVVVGDVQASEVVAQIRDAYARSKARAIPPVVLPSEPRQTAPREVIEEARIELGHMYITYHIPELRHPDVPILDVLSIVLGSGRSSRLYQEVRERKGLVHSASAWTYNPGNPGLFGLSALVDGDKFSAAREALLAELERLQTKESDPAEVGKAVKQLVSATLATRKTMAGQAQDLGSNWLAANDLNFSHRYLDAVKRVTPTDLQRVAREYLTPDNRTVYALLPTGAAPKPQRVGELPGQNAIQKFEFANGLRLLVKEDHRLPFVEFRSVFQGGVLVESPANNGLTHLTGKLLLKGTRTRSAEQIAREIESVGGSIDVFGGNNSFGVNAEVLKEDFATGLELVADVLLNSVFQESALDRERQIQLAGIRAQRDNLLRSANIAMRRAMFGDSGYGLDLLGSEESLARIKPADLRDFHERLTVPDNCVLAIYGDVQAASVKASVEKAFADWKRAGLRRELREAPALKEVRRVTESRDKKQAVLVIGFRGATLHDPDRYALELLQEACSDLGSRLFLRIREKLGLAYYVGAQNFLGLSPGYFSFYVGTAPEKLDLVEKELLKEAGLLREQGLTPEELNRAKAKIIGQKKIARQDLGSLALTTALDELFGLGYDRSETDDAQYESVTLEQVTAVARKFLKADAMVISSIGPGN